MHFGNLRAVQVKVKRHAVAINDQHLFGAFALAGQPGGSPPFCLVIYFRRNEPSKNACAHSNLPCASSVESMVCRYAPTCLSGIAYAQHEQNIIECFAVIGAFSACFGGRGQVRSNQDALGVG